MAAIEPTNEAAKRSTIRREREGRALVRGDPRGERDRLTFIAATAEQCGIIVRIGVAIVITLEYIGSPDSPVIRSANGAPQECIDNA